MTRGGERQFGFWPRALSLKSLRGRMALLLGLAMLPAGAIAMQVGLNAVAARQQAAQEELGRRALQSITEERQTIDQVREMLRVLASSPELRDSGAPDCRAWLDGVVARYRTLAGISVLDRNRVVRCSVPAVAPGTQIAPLELMETARTRDNFAIGYVSQGPVSRREVLAGFEPLRDANGRSVGFIGASIAVEDLREILDRGRTLDGARSAIIDQRGGIVAQSSVGTSGDEPGLPTPEQIRSMLGSSPQFIEVENGTAVIVPLYEPDLYAVMSWGQSRARWRDIVDISTSIAAPLLIWLLAVGAGWFAIEIFVARPLSQLESAARSFARGEDVVEPPALASAPEEVRTLRRTLAAMAKTLRGREQKLVETLGEERALLREVHHRVKNNLQMVASLLNIQARAAADESEARGLARAHDRVQLMALVHQRIYASGEVRALRLDDLAAEIARQMQQSRGAAAKDITLKLELSEARVDVDHAVPAAFLIGEAISNALDLLADESAELTLRLRPDAEGGTEMSLDGEAQGVAAVQSPSVRLIDAFARQLGAAVRREPQRPYALWVRLPPQAER